MIVFVLSGCIFRTTTEEEKTLFIPINSVIYEEKSIYSYTIKDAIEGDNIHIFSRFSEKEIDKKEDKLQLSKKVENSFSSIPEDSNLWIEIYWYDYDDAFWKKEQTIKPDGYNVYRSFDGVDYTKVATTTNGPYIDYSSDLKVGKETWYKVSSYKDGEESNKVKLGSVTPLDTFNVRLISPKGKALDVSVQPTFVWEPTKKLISSESEIEYHYTMAIYDFIQSANYIYPVTINNGQIYTYDFNTNGSTQVSVTFKGSEGSPEYDDLEWIINLENNDYFYPTNLLEKGKTYDWGIDYAYAIAYDKDKRSHSDEFCSLHHAKNARIGT